MKYYGPSEKGRAWIVETDDMTEAKKRVRLVRILSFGLVFWAIYYLVLPLKTSLLPYLIIPIVTLPIFKGGGTVRSLRLTSVTEPNGMTHEREMTGHLMQILGLQILGMVLALIKVLFLNEY